MSTQELITIEAQRLMDATYDAIARREPRYVCRECGREVMVSDSPDADRAGGLQCDCGAPMVRVPSFQFAGIDPDATDDLLRRDGHIQ